MKNNIEINYVEDLEIITANSNKEIIENILANQKEPIEVKTYEICKNAPYYLGITITISVLIVLIAIINFRKKILNKILLFFSIINSISMIVFSLKAFFFKQKIYFDCICNEDIVRSIGNIAMMRPLIINLMFFIILCIYIFIKKKLKNQEDNDHEQKNS